MAANRSLADANLSKQAPFESAKKQLGNLYGELGTLEAQFKEKTAVLQSLRGFIELFSKKLFLGEKLPRPKIVLIILKLHSN